MYGLRGQLLASFHTQWLPAEAVLDLELDQMDVKIIFLSCNLNEEIYMKQHEEYVLPKNEKKACMWFETRTKTTV